MLRPRRVIALASVLSLAACSAPATSATPAAADPKAVLTVATTGLTAGNYRYTAALSGTRIEGAVDFANRSTAWTTTSQETGRTDIDMRLIGRDQYSRTRHDAASAADTVRKLRKTVAAAIDPDVKADAKAEIREIETKDHRYRHFDLSRFPDNPAAQGAGFTGPDRTGITALLPWVREATVDGKTIRGTLTFVGTPSAQGALNLIADRYVDTMTFTGSLDDQGRLSRLDIDLPASSHPKRAADRCTLTIDSYGTTPTPERPTSAKETPESTYRALGG